jgi:phosphoadenosine phosphosulfate reductase
MEGVAMVISGENRAQIFASGSVTARSDSDRDARKLMKRIELSVRRALFCSGCGVCVGKCPQGLIKMKKGLAIINEGCTHCGKCIEVCPVVKFNS